MKRRDKHNLLGNPIEEMEKKEKNKARDREVQKKRAKGTGRIDRSMHTKTEDL